MGVLVGPTPWWQSNIVKSCPVGTTLPDGSRIICKASGKAWIVAPASTQVGMAWAGGFYNSVSVTTTYPGRDFSCVCEWNTLQSCLITSGFNPSDWFVPSCSLLQNPGYAFRCQWDSFSSAAYWSSTECGDTSAYGLNFPNGDLNGRGGKAGPLCVRAFRCVTY